MLSRLMYSNIAESTFSILEAPNGYSEALFQGNMEWEILTKDLGASYRLVDPGFDIKRFPAQIHMQNTIEAVLNLRQNYDLRFQMVDQLTIHSRGRGHSGPLPISGLDGKFSIEYCSAAALLDGKVGIETFTDKRRFSPDMEKALTKVQVVADDTTRAVITATARLKDGTIVSAECSAFRGSASNPMNRDERLEKILDCSRRNLSERDTERLLALLENLEHVSDICDVMEILRPAGPE